METTVKVIPTIFPTIALIIWLIVIGVGIYLIFLLIKALRVYIKNNS